MQEIVFGTCDGTGAAINVVLGFTPDYVKVWNVQGSIESLEWFKAMAPFTGTCDEGVLSKASTDSFLTSDGISAYAGGDEITYDGTTDNRWEDSAGNSAEEVYVDGHFKLTADAAPLYRCFGTRVVPNLIDGAKVKTTEGFTIGAQGDLNVNGEQLCWMAIRELEN